MVWSSWGLHLELLIHLSDVHTYLADNQGLTKTYWFSDASKYSHNRTRSRFHEFRILWHGRQFRGEFGRESSLRIFVCDLESHWCDVDLSFVWKTVPEWHNRNDSFVEIRRNFENWLWLCRWTVWTGVGRNPRARKQGLWIVNQEQVCANFILFVKAFRTEKFRFFVGFYE